LKEKELDDAAVSYVWSVWASDREMHDFLNMAIPEKLCLLHRFGDRETAGRCCVKKG
jgi:hypothetical protein